MCLYGPYPLNAGIAGRMLRNQKKIEWKLECVQLFFYGLGVDGRLLSFVCHYLILLNVGELEVVQEYR